MHYLEFGLRIYVAYPCDFCVTAFFSRSCLCFLVEAELKKKTEKKTKEDSPIFPLNCIPPSGNAPKKTKEDSLFYSPESYTSCQKCSVSIY